MNILPTPVIGVLGVIDDVRRRTIPGIGQDTGETLLLLGDTRDEFDGSAWAEVVHDHLGGLPPKVDLEAERTLGDDPDRRVPGRDDLRRARPVRGRSGAGVATGRRPLRGVVLPPATKYAFGYEYFADQGLTVGPVTAPPSTADDPNGVHCYEDAACGSFPVRDYRSSTYWVTPLWQATDGPPPGSPPGAPTVDQEPPRVIGGGPARGAQGVKAAAAKVKVRFSEPVRRDTLTRRTVRLLVGAKATLVKVRLRYDADRERVVLTPRKPLRSATTYRVQVTTGVRDVAGNRLDQMPKKAGLQKATWTFRTR